MYNIYVPFEDLSFYSNYYFNEDLSLIYATNDNFNYSIVDLKNHYQVVNSQLDLSNYELIEINFNDLTNDYKYRNDFVDICLLVVIFSIFFFYIPLKLFFRLFKRSNL